MTNPSEFDKLPMEDKNELLKSKGRFRGIRQTLEYLFGLYELNGFFVELTYSNKENVVSKIASIAEPLHYNYSLDWPSKQAIDRKLYN